ncbi:MAG TPA: DUF6079 family protein [Acidimicrobiales bacterium]|nr:DUF6079 family protein [Acidimicrobiales bacterium]
MTEASPTIGDLVEVAVVDTVVRLDGPGARLGELVLTGDVVSSLSAVLRAAAGEAGAGFFVVGPFGSGKSHFLAAAGELLADPAAAAGLAGWTEELRALAGAARPSVAVGVPLVEYRAGAALEDVVAARAWRALGRRAPASGTDRRESWDAFLAAAAEAGHGGAVLLLDELSEFLRAKQGPALTEDLRFLQFLGEWAGERPALVVAALQEDIEAVANVSGKELARIRDRYRPSLTLSMRHVEDLVRGRLVRLRPGAERWVEQAREGIVGAFPGAPVDGGRLARCYPLHPDTLSVLEGLRFLLSQQRGVVDFICRRLAACLDRPYDGLVTPDDVFDHFRGRLHERPETARLADTVVPYFERGAPELVDGDDVDLALRAVKLMCLLAASPLERPRTAAELAGMLLARVSDLDPQANAGYLEKAVLTPLAGSGAYLVAEPGPPVTYTVVPDADAGMVARNRVEQARAELSPGDRRVAATLAELGSSPTLPLQLQAQVGTSRREVMWQNTQRSVLLVTTRVLDLDAGEAAGLVQRARAAGAEGCLVLAEPELEEQGEADARAADLVAAVERLAVWVPGPVRAAERDAVLDVHSRRLVLVAARDEDRDDLVEVLERTAGGDAAVCREALRRMYFEGRVHGPGAAPDLPSLAGLPFERLLPAVVDPLLSALHPRHFEVAPRGELVGDRFVRELLRDAVVPGRLGAAAVSRGPLRSLIEGYLVPLGLAKVRKDGATVGADPARSPAVAEVLRLVGDGGPVPAEDVMTGLAEGPFGLTAMEAVLVLNVCVQTGLLEARRGNRPLTDPFVAVTPADRLASGQLVEPAVRQAVLALGPVCGPGPFDPWTAAAQRSAWEYLQAWLEARREDLAQVRAGLARVVEVPALGGADVAPVVDDAALVGAVVEACPPSLGAAAGLTRMASVVDDPAGMVAAARRLGAVARFLRDDLRRVEEAAAYLTSSDLALPDEGPLAGARDAALALARDCLDLAARDRVADFAAANREFRSAYVAAYQEAHDRHYGAVSPGRLDEVRQTPAYRALTRLASIGAVAVPDDRVKVDRLLAAAGPRPCRARVETELAWKPRCQCGFTLGTPLPVLDAGAVVATAERGVGQYLTELSGEEHRARLEAAAADLDALGRTEMAAGVRRLVELAGGRAPDAEAVAAALAGDLPAVLRDALTGAQLIVTRDLAALREDLIGRRYPKRRLLELLASWVDPGGEVPPGGFVEVVDSADRPPLRAPAPEPARPRAVSATEAVLAERFPGLAALLPADQAADAFWLAAWWAERPAPPPWVPSRLFADPDRLAAAADAALGDLAARAELADLDGRVGPGTVLGDQVAAALGLAGAPAADVAAVLAGERLLRHPVRLAADQFLRRLAADVQLVRLVAGAGALAPQHALLAPAEVAPLALLVEAARHLAAVEREGAEATPAALVEEVYASHYAAVPELVSRAALACAGPAVVGEDAVDAFRIGARRVLSAVDARFRLHADAGFPGCLPIWEVGAAVVAPLLAQHGRVGVLLVDAMRADAARLVARLVADALPGRPVAWRWAVVPHPTRTAESVAALRLGRPVPAGSASHSGPGDVPFAHLGYEGAVLVRADRDHSTDDLKELWASGPPVSVAVATGIDERLHRTSVELAALLDDSVAGVARRVVPSLVSLPASVPLVVLADHGFRENPSWGRGPEGRYVHGGTSPEECVVPVVLFGP